MSQQRLVIDSLEFARHRQALQGRVSAAELSRLEDVLSGTEGSLVFSVAGEFDGDGNAYLHLDVTGQLQLACQRCLGGIEHAVNIHKRLALVKAGADWPEEDVEDESLDAIEADRSLDLRELIEEEVLLSLPIAPCHEEFRPPEYREEAGKPSPFASLARLKGSRTD